MKQSLPVHEPTAGYVIDCFNLRFGVSEGTILVGGADEPYYEPGSPNIIYFREDFVRSALHEVAHWCVAGAARRTLPDSVIGTRQMGETAHNKQRSMALR